MKHYPLRVHVGKDLTGWFSEGHADTLIVFVHGFAGDPSKTWRGFPRVIDSDKAYSDADALFLAYDSIRSSVRVAAEELLRTIERVYPRHQGIFGSSVDLERDYRSLVLVGHSLGGVVIRRAVALSRKAPQNSPVSDLTKADLRLLAPALGGARPAGLLGVAKNAGALFSAVLAVSGFSPSYNELTGDGDSLLSLRQQTESWADREPGFDATKARVWWAARDNVVTEVEYLHDTVYPSLPGSDHTSISKPTLHTAVGKFPICD